MAQQFVSQGRCQFCHKTAENVEHIIAGDSGFICNECVAACSTLLQPAAAGPVREERREGYAFQRLARHFAPLRPQELLATSRSYPLRQQADLQAALDELFGERILPRNFVGIRAQYRHEVTDFAKLLEQSHGAVEVAPAQFEDIDVGGGETRRCLKNGLWLLRDDRGPYAIVLSQHTDYGHGGSYLNLEVAAPPGDFGAEVASRLFDALERQLSRGSCYRGRVLSLETSPHWTGHAARIRVHQLEPVERDEVILPDATLRAVERNVLRFAEQRPALRAMGLSTQKGLLFHGAPGTGKTHCIRYLAGKLPGHTTLLITAEEMGILPEYMALARLLQPALVVIEDADLIARDRSERASACDEVMLNRLLNELDGLRERADVFFVLTTNRPDTLEPALASRPGRIDQAIEFPLPDERLRRRLAALYARTLTLSPELMDDVARRTDGASPAFIKELLRRVAQHHLDADAKGAVSSATVEAALHEMLFSGGTLNARLLGGEAVSEEAASGDVRMV
ncbi:MAG TPA: AAA family ATPase [Vicinamibacterales bacterium]|nr:AAA family ATPase [Vicinamibacterales bacterium]